MTQAFNLSQLANKLNSSGQLNAANGLYGILPADNGGSPWSVTGSDIFYNSGNVSLGANVYSGGGIKSFNITATYPTIALYDNTNTLRFSVIASAAQTEFNSGIYKFANANGSTEYVRFNTIGQVMVGTSSPISAGWLTLNYDGQNYNGLMTKTTTSGTYYGAMFKNVSDSFVGNISVSASATAYNTSSDYRLKDNVAPMTGALARVALLKPVTYSWKIDGSDGEGFIAHELQEVCPLAVTGDKDAVFEDGSVKAQSIDTSFLVATLTAAIQEQQALIENLIIRLSALENK